MSARQIDKSFSVELGALVRTVVLSDGRKYRHRCELETFKAVAYCIEQHGDDGVTTDTLWQELKPMANTQISVALDFLKDRGCVDTRWRRSFPASGFLYEDAMIEFCYLAQAKE